MYKLLILIFSIITLSSFGQQNDKSGHFGGPISTITTNKLGTSISFGGWGTFIMKGDFQAGIYGQISTSIISKSPEHIDYSHYQIKNRFTGFWLGYYQSFEAHPNIHLSYFSKFGFGSVFIDDIKTSTTIYDKSFSITPSIESVFKIFPFMHIGLGVFYEIHTGVNLLEYSSKDYNTMGLSISFRFCPKG